MARVSQLQTNFTAGELSNRLLGRPDLSKYKDGAELLENVVVFPHGGVSRRSGTKFVKEVKVSANNTRLIPFEFSVTQAYVLEFGDEIMRVYKDGGSVLEANKTISGATKANPCVITATSHGYSNGDEVFISSVVGMTELNGKYYKVKNKATNTFELTDIDDVNINSSAFTTYGSAGTAARVYTIATPYDKDDLDEIQYAQSADILFLSHKDYSPRKISRTGHTDFTITAIAFNDGPYLTENVTTTTLTASGASGSVNITASATTGINNDQGWLETDVGRLIRIGHQATAWAASTSFSVGNVRRNAGSVYECIKAGTSAGSGGPTGDGDEIVDNNVSWKFLNEGGIHFGNATIASRSSATVVAVTTNEAFSATSGETKWRLGSWSGTTGYPAATTFFEQRLFFGGSKDEPQTIWGSRSADYENFKPGTLDDDPVQYQIASNDVNAIRWLISGRALFIGTVGGEFVMQASSLAEALTPTNVKVTREGTRGASTSAPVKVDEAVLYIQRQKRKLREMVYVFDSDSFNSPDLTLLSEQVAYGGLNEITYQQELDSIIWGIRNDGQLVGLTYLRDQKVVAWHRHIIGGRFGEATITVTDFANIAVGTEIEFTKSDGTTVTYKSEAVGASDPADLSLGFRPNTNNNTTADNIFTRIVASSATTGLTCENPSANVIIVTETAKSSTGFLTVKTSDTTRLATTDEDIAQVTSLASIPGVGADQLWLIVKRTINGVTRQYIEYLAPNFNADDGNVKEDAVFSDSLLTYSGSATGTITGLDHVEGQTVSILGDGSFYIARDVSSGSITGLSPTVKKAQVGLGYKSTIKTLRPEIGSEDGTAQGKTKRVFEVMVRFINTLGCKFGPNLNDLDEILFRQTYNPMDSSAPLFTGDKIVKFHGGWETEGQIFIVQDQPLPMTVSCVVTRLTNNDG